MKCDFCHGHGVITARNVYKCTFCNGRGARLQITRQAQPLVKARERTLWRRFEKLVAMRNTILERRLQCHRRRWLDRIEAALNRNDAERDQILNRFVEKRW